MPISSTQVSNIIGGQIGMFSASAQYSQAISAQYGFQPGGAPFPNDPFQQNQMQQNLAAGGRMANFGVGAASMGMGALSTAAMFGMAPRIFDPFTSGAHAFMGGMRTGGMMGGMASGALAFGAVSAGIGAVGYGFDQMRTGVQNRMMLTQQAGQVMPGMGVGGLNAVAGQIESMNRQGYGSLQELTGLMRQGANSGALNTSSLSEFTMSFQKLVTNVRQVATALNTTIGQAQQAMQEVKAMGISSDNAAGFLGTARAFGAQVGLGPQQMMQYASMGSSFAANAGIHRELGASGAVMQAGVYGLANRQGVAGVLPDSYQRYMGGASRFLSSRYGRNVLGAMLDTRTGGLNMQVARQISVGGMTRQQINALSRSNIAEYGRDAFEASRGELGASFISEFGPQSLGLTIEDMTAGSSSPQMLRRRLTGLNRADFMGMQNLQAQTSQLTNQLTSAAREGFRQGQQNTGFSGRLSQAFDDMVRPVKDRFRQMGANLAQSMQQAVADFNSEFSGTPGMSQGTMNAAFMRQHRAATMGGDAAFMDMLRQQNAQLSPQLGFNLAPGGPGDDPSMMQSLARRLPAAFRIGSYSPGTGFSELPMHGLGTEQYSGMQTGIALGMIPGGYALGHLGRGIQAVGSAGVGFTNANFPSSGFLGLGGRGPIGGTMMGASRGLQGVGLLSRGVGRAARFAGPAAIAYDLMTNVMPEARRRAGVEAITAGAITGQNARFTNFLADVGALGDDGIREMSLDDYHNLGPSERGLLTPISGFSEGPSVVSSGGSSSVRAGRQRFVTAAGRDKMMQMGSMGSQRGAAAAFRMAGSSSAIEPEQARRIIQGAANSIIAAQGDTWTNATPQQRIAMVTQQLQDAGRRGVSPADVVQLSMGLVLRDGSRVVPSGAEGMVGARHLTPEQVREQTVQRLNRQSTMHALRAHQSGNSQFRLNDLGLEARRQFMTDLQDTLGASGLSHVLKNAAGEDNPTGVEESNLVHRQNNLDFIPAEHLSGEFASAFQTGSDAEQAMANVLTGRRGNSLTHQRNALGYGAHHNLMTNMAGGGTYHQNQGYYAAFAGHIVGHGGEALNEQLANASLAYNTGDRRRQNQAIASATRLLNSQGGVLTSAFTSGSMGGFGVANTDGNFQEDLVRALLDQNQYGGSIQAVSNARDAGAYLQARQQRLDLFNGITDGGNYRARIEGGVREAAEMSGANGNFIRIMNESMARYHGETGLSGRTGGRQYSESSIVAGRQQLMDTLQTRLRGASSAVSESGRGAAISAALGSGGTMTMQDLDRLGAELLQEDSVALQDMGQMVTNMARFRRGARTQGGMGRGRSQQHVAENVLGLRFSGSSREEDLRFIRGERGAVMSLNLEGQLRTMARSALQAASPGHEPSAEQIEQKMGRITAAIRDENAVANGYEELNQVMNTVAPPQNPNSAAPSGRDGSRIAANMGDLNTVTRQFVENVAMMNAAMNGQSSTDPAAGGNSDIRLKWDITKVGKSPSGIPLYTFRYKDDPEAKKYNGAMAQDLLKLAPDAVLVGKDNYYRVRYDLIDVGFYQINEGTK